MLTYNLTDHEDLPLYECLYRHIRDDILSNKLLPDDKLPSKRAFAEALGVSVITVEGAYRQLKAEGYIASRERSGYYVRNIESRPHAKAIAKARPAAPSAKYEIADFSSSPKIADESFMRLWEKTIRGLFATEPQSELYARQPPQGSLRLREAIASWLSRTRGIATSPERIIVTAGAPMLYSLVALMCGGEGGVALESPGYQRLKNVYESLGRQVWFIPLDDEGIDSAKLEESGASLAHIMPSHQFPTGRVTSVSRRYELLGWASRDEVRYIVEDDYDCEFRLSGKPIPSLSSIDAEGKVIYLGTFSKSLSPSLRIAFGVFPPSFDERLEQVLGCFSSTIGTIEQIALARLMETGEYERHVNRYRIKARNARDHLIGALRESAVAHKLAFEECDSGLHFILCVDTVASAGDIAKAAAARGVGLAPLERYDFGNTMHPDERPRFVIQFEGVEDEKLMLAARAISDVIEAAERQ